MTKNANTYNGRVVDDKEQLTSTTAELMMTKNANTYNGRKKNHSINNSILFLNFPLN